MKQLSRFLVFTFLATSVFVAAACAMAEDEFKAGQFQGLALGKATIEAAIARFGEPTDTFDDGRGGYWIYYQDIGPVPGRVEIIGDSMTRLIETVVVYPSKKLSVQDAEKRLGPDFKLIHYNFDECLGDGGEAPIYESPKGSLAFSVSSALGIALKVGHEKVDFIEYLSKPLGSKTSRCQHR
jgi:hypothetical protein